MPITAKDILAATKAEILTEMPSLGGARDDETPFYLTSYAFGGAAMDMHLYKLKAAGIPARRIYSPYQNLSGVAVPDKYAKKAEKLLFNEGVERVPAILDSAFVTAVQRKLRNLGIPAHLDDGYHGTTIYFEYPNQVEGAVGTLDSTTWTGALSYVDKAHKLRYIDIKTKLDQYDKDVDKVAKGLFTAIMQAVTQMQGGFKSIRNEGFLDRFKDGMTIAKAAGKDGLQQAIELKRRGAGPEAIAIALKLNYDDHKDLVDRFHRGPGGTVNEGVGNYMLKRTSVETPEDPYPDDPTSDWEPYKITYYDIMKDGKVVGELQSDGSQYMQGVLHGRTLPNLGTYAGGGQDAQGHFHRFLKSNTGKKFLEKCGITEDTDGDIAGTSILYRPGQNPKLVSGPPPKTTNPSTEAGKSIKFRAEDSQGLEHDAVDEDTTLSVKKCDVCDTPIGAGQSICDACKKKFNKEDVSNLAAMAIGSAAGLVGSGALGYAYSKALNAGGFKNLFKKKAGTTPPQPKPNGFSNITKICREGRDFAMRCLECEKAFKSSLRDPKCPKCGSHDVDLDDVGATYNFKK